MKFLIFAPVKSIAFGAIDVFVRDKSIHPHIVGYMSCIIMCIIYIYIYNNIPSGYLMVCYGKWPFIDDVPIKSDFPWLC